MGAELIINEQWGLAIPPIPQAFTQVVDVAANAIPVLKTIPLLYQRWIQLRVPYDNMLQTRLGHSLDPYYQMTKESQLAAVLLMNPNASQVELFDMCVGIQASRPVTTAELQTQWVKANQQDQAVAAGTAFGKMPPGA